MANHLSNSAARRSWLQRVQSWLRPAAASQRRAVSMRPTGSAPYLGEIAIFTGNYEPVGWLFCSGQTLLISEYSDLFNLIGTTYGGNGTSTFNLPDLRGRLPLHPVQRPGGSPYALGQAGGQETVGLTLQQLPVHSHALPASSDPGTTASPIGAVPADNGAGAAQYVPALPSTPPTQNTGSSGGGSQPHSNIQPVLAVNYIIAVQGIFPSPT